MDVENFDNKNKVTFCGVVIGLHLLGILIKCAYYQFGHPWMSISKSLQKTSACLFGIYGIIGITILGALFYFGIVHHIKSLIVTGTLVCLLAGLAIVGIGNKFRKASIDDNIEMETCTST